MKYPEHVEGSLTLSVRRFTIWTSCLKGEADCLLHRSALFATDGCCCVDVSFGGLFSLT